MSDAPRIERDPGFWIDVASHPEVRPSLSELTLERLAECVADPRVLPVRAEQGGYLFLSLDVVGRAYDLHALFKPEGWGSEPAPLFRQCAQWLFGGGAQLITIHESGTNPRSRPAASYGFRPAGPMAQTPLGPLRTWVLTLNGWLASPVYRRMVKCHHS